MYKKQKIEIMIEVELHAPNLLSAYKNKNQVCGKPAQQINNLLIFKF